MMTLLFPGLSHRIEVPDDVCVMFVDSFVQFEGANDELYAAAHASLQWILMPSTPVVEANS